MLQACYEILRKNSDVLVTLLRMMLCTGIPELNSTSISIYKITKRVFKYILSIKSR